MDIFADPLGAAAPSTSTPLPPAASSSPPPEEVLRELRGAIVRAEQQEWKRTAQELKLRLARELMALGAWDDALRVLRPLWQGMSWRAEGWWDVMEEVGWALRSVAGKVGDRGTMVAVDWELMSDIFVARRDWNYDVAAALDGLETTDFKPAVVIRDHDVHSFLTSTFAFERMDGKVGESCTSQLTVTSGALLESAAVTVAEIRIMFEGSMKSIILRHEAKAGGEESGYGDVLYSRVLLTEGPAFPNDRASSRDSRSIALLGETDLTFPPGKSRVFEFVCPLREAGEARAISATFTLAPDLFDLDYIVHFNRTPTPDVHWWQKLGKKRLVRVDPHVMNILPKPPKMDLHFVSFQEQYYTNEAINLQLDISNGEDDESIAQLAVHVTGDQIPPYVLRSAARSSEAGDDSSPSPQTVDSSGDASLELGRIASSTCTSAVLVFPPVTSPAMYDLTVRLSYHLVSDLETPVSKTTTVRLLVVSAFEANYDFSPRLDPAPWPDFFSYQESEETPLKESGLELDHELEKASAPQLATGLAQRWCLTARYASFATEPLVIDDISIATVALNGGITCTSSAMTSATTPNSPAYPLSIRPNGIEEAQFSVLTRKTSLDDRSSASLDLVLVIKWRRSSSEAKSNNTSTLPIPRLLVASSEPRVLASLTHSTLSVRPSSPSSSSPSSSMKEAANKIPFVTLSYTIENPSLHFLTFSVAMTTSERFAFSGVKTGTVQLLPLSRRTVKFRVLGTGAGARTAGDGVTGGGGGGEWIKVHFVVRDRYFQKVLRVVPASDSECLKTDKDGVLVWMPSGLAGGLK